VNREAALKTPRRFSRHRATLSVHGYSALPGPETAADDRVGGHVLLAVHSGHISRPARIVVHLQRCHVAGRDVAQLDEGRVGVGEVERVRLACGRNGWKEAWYGSGQLSFTCKPVEQGATGQVLVEEDVGCLRHAPI
jgi:hypothetical protein